MEDPDFGVSVSAALKLHRQVEYCQWQETKTEKCETCSRQRDGKEETYRSVREVSTSANINRAACAALSSGQLAVCFSIWAMIVERRMVCLCVCCCALKKFTSAQLQLRHDIPLHQGLAQPPHHQHLLRPGRSFCHSESHNFVSRTSLCALCLKWLVLRLS